ncbi:hypothetical protein D3C84_630650 [compost metagenome]
MIGRCAELNVFNIAFISKVADNAFCCRVLYAERTADRNNRIPFVQIERPREIDRLDMQRLFRPDDRKIRIFTAYDDTFHLERLAIDGHRISRLRFIHHMIVGQNILFPDTNAAALTKIGLNHHDFLIVERYVLPRRQNAVQPLLLGSLLLRLPDRFRRPDDNLALLRIPFHFGAERFANDADWYEGRTVLHLNRNIQLHARSIHNRRLRSDLQRYRCRSFLCNNGSRALLPCHTGAQGVKDRFHWN